MTSRWYLLVVVLLPAALAGCASPRQNLAAVGESCIAWFAGKELRWMKVAGTTPREVRSCPLPEPVLDCAPATLGDACGVVASGANNLYVTRTWANATTALVSVAPDVVRDLCAHDLDGDGWDEVLVLAGERATGRGELRIYSLRHRRWIWRGLRPELHPWKVRAGDVDGDQSPDVVVGVWKTTRFDPVWDNRPFVYQWLDGDLHPSWLGSRLPKRFTDFELADTDQDGRDEIVAVGRTEDGNCLFSCERYGFGFWGAWTGQVVSKISHVSPGGSPATVFTSEGDSRPTVWAYRTSEDAVRVERVAELRAAPQAFCALDDARLAYVDRDRLRVLTVRKGGT